jgi:hypothetical protein
MIDQTAVIVDPIVLIYPNCRVFAKSTGSDGIFCREIYQIKIVISQIPNRFIGITSIPAT